MNIDRDFSEFERKNVLVPCSFNSQSHIYSPAHPNLKSTWDLLQLGVVFHKCYKTVWSYIKHTIHNKKTSMEERKQINNCEIDLLEGDDGACKIPTPCHPIKKLQLCLYVLK